MSFFKADCVVPKISIRLAIIAVAGLGAHSALAQQMTPEMRAKALAVERACKPELKQYCAGIAPGGGRIVACLQKNAAALSPACQTAFSEAMQK